MTGLLIAMLLWLSDNSDLDTAVTLPNVVMTDHGNICGNYGITTAGNCAASRLVAFYNKHNTIYLPVNFGSADADDSDRLLHELVHYVQWQNGLGQTTCLGQLEVQAYELQDLWRAQRGLPPSRDEFKMLMLAASCES